MSPQRPSEELLQEIWDFMAFQNHLTPADVIIGGGCTDLGVARHCADLYHQGLAPLIVFTGYKQLAMQVTEAALFTEEAVKHGVPSAAILQEPNASNTGQNITLSQALLQSQGILPARVILVHKPYMARRFLATAQAQWKEKAPEFIVSHEAISMHDYMQRQGREYTIGKLLGDFDRMTAYVRKGFQAPQIIPPEIAAIRKELQQRGFEGR
jgi:uncharacterized SAM-binding protein YcdF (DUF218 family)